MFDKKLLESSELYAKRYKNFATLIIFPVVILFVGLLVFMIFADKQLEVSGVGEIEPVRIIDQLQSTSSNIIVENKMSEGEQIKKNELLVRYNSEADTTTLDSLITEFDQDNKQKAQLNLLQESLMEGRSLFKKADSFGYEQTFENYLAQVQNLKSDVNKSNQTISNQNITTSDEKAAIAKQITILNQQINDYTEIENVVSSGGRVSSDNPYLAQYNGYQDQINALKATTEAEQQADTNSQIASLKSQFLATLGTNISNLQSQLQSFAVQSSSLTQSDSYDTSLESQVLALKSQSLSSSNKEMTDLNNSLSELKAKIALQKQEDKYSEIRASNEGILHVLPNVLGVKHINAGTPIAEIYPKLKDSTKVKMVTYLSSVEISGIKTGQKLRFTVQQSLPHPEILEGKIVSIDSAPTTIDKINTYKVTSITKLKKSDLKYIRYGLQGKAVVVTGNKTYFNYFLDKALGKD